MSDTLFGDEVQDPTDRLIKELWKTPGWPKDPVRDRALMAELQQQFPALDLAEEFGKFRVWLLARGTGKEVTSRGRFQRVRNWCSNAVRYGADSATSRPRAGRGRTSTAARPVEAFGTESSVSLSRW